MIPGFFAFAGAAGSKPRASGDDPDAESAMTNMTSVNPARAGMIPRRRPPGTPGTCKPRASGDDPDPLDSDASRVA